MVEHRGRCHCGEVEVEITAPADLVIHECNCSICNMAGYQHVIVPKERFRLVSGEASVSEYRFGTRTARHLFCSTCGIKVFYVPRSHPDGVSVNLRCLDPATIENTRFEDVDGKNWEQHYPSGRAAEYPN